MSDVIASPAGDVLSPEFVAVLKKRAVSARDLYLALLAEEGDGPRPLAVELCGTVASGKTSATRSMQKFFRRCGYRVHAPLEGAEAVETPRPEPGYNLATYHYAMLKAFMHSVCRAKQVGLFDRAVYDAVVRMEYYRAEGKLTVEEHAAVEAYMRMSHNVDVFDLHVFLMCRPETTLARKNADDIMYEPGATVNPTALEKLYEAHQRVWDRFDLGSRPDFLWLDSDQLTKKEVGRLIALAAVEAFERRLAREP